MVPIGRAGSYSAGTDLIEIECPVLKNCQTRCIFGNWPCVSTSVAGSVVDRLVLQEVLQIGEVLQHLTWPIACLYSWEISS